MIARTSAARWRMGLVRSAATAVVLFGATCAPGPWPLAAQEKDITESDPPAAAAKEAELVSHVRQLTFEGRRAGEGYFDRAGKQLVFQSEREPGNPFFQIYTLDLESGDLDRVSPGTGKTTCSWFHPDGQHILFASTHEDPRAQDKQTAELKAREEGREKRYGWDYDEWFDIFVYDRNTKRSTNLTHTRGYDAEGDYSPDGRQIVFASNRRAYEKRLSDKERQHFETDPAYMMDIFIMNADGTHVRQLTDAPGYDGGPFFSPDGQRICWRRFSENGALAEVYTMRTDGSDQQQVTRLGAMSWAPFYHPSGEYLIFTTNRHGFSNFELYLVDVQGQSTPVRVTYTPGFDGLPVFTPDGKKLAWTSNRTASKQSQIFIADWNHERARQLLGLDRAAAAVPPAPASEEAATQAARSAAEESAQHTSVDFVPQDIRRHVNYLCRPELEGRRVGTEGERLATAYVAAYFESLGLEPAGDDGTWFQPFEFTSGVALGDTNRLAWGDKTYELNRDWRPVAFSQTGAVPAGDLAFAGYGMVVPKSGDQAEYDSYVHADVTDKWVIVLRYMPENAAAERRQAIARYASLRYKSMIARDRGARGLIVVSGPNAKVRRQLVELSPDGSISGASLPVISVTDEVAEAWLAAGGKHLKDLQDRLDTGEPMMGFDVPQVKLEATIDIRQVKSTGRNVLARLRAGEKPADQCVLIGAHVDHLGKGANPSSLAREDERDEIHYGADDNASGVAAMLEVAQYLADQKKSGKLAMRRDALFAAWSGEEAGLIGSSHFAKVLAAQLGTAGSAAKAAPGGPAAGAAKVPATAGAPANPHAGAADPIAGSLYPAIAVCLNMDMVGRLDKQLIMQGVGSSSIWRSEIERRNVPVGLPIALQEDSYIPSDGSTFFMRGVPMLSAFTGSHAEYHTPRDRPETLNYDGAARVAHLMGLITRSLVTRDAPPDYVPQAAPAGGPRRANLRAYLGTIPDYAEEVKGVKLSGVSKGAPADQAGLKGGDVIVELAGKKIENIYDYTYAIEALKVGQKVKVVVQRGSERLTLDLTPGSRE